MIGFQLRSGEPSDSEWLFKIYRQSMEPLVESAWGWDEEFQHEGFHQHLSSKHWIIVRYKDRDLGGYVLKNREDYFWLEMIVVLPNYRKLGIGSRIVEHLQGMASPLRLSVIKSSPAINFYLKRGFVQYDEDEHSCKLEWKIGTGKLNLL